MNNDSRLWMNAGGLYENNLRFFLSLSTVYICTQKRKKHHEQSYSFWLTIITHMVRLINYLMPHK